MKDRKRKSGKKKNKKKEESSNDELGENYYQIDKVLKTKKDANGQIWSYVSWKGYGSDDNSWVHHETVQPYH